MGGVLLLGRVVFDLLLALLGFSLAALGLVVRVDFVRTCCAVGGSAPHVGGGSWFSVRGSCGWGLPPLLPEKIANFLRWVNYALLFNLQKQNKLTYITNLKHCTIMAQNIRKAVTADKKAAGLEFKSFSAGVVAIVCAERSASLSAFYEGAPKQTASRSVIKAWAQDNLYKGLAHVLFMDNGTAHAKHIAFTTDEKRALTLDETYTAASFVGIARELSAVDGACLPDSALHTRRFSMILTRSATW